MCSKNFICEAEMNHELIIAFIELKFCSCWSHIGICGLQSHTPMYNTCTHTHQPSNMTNIAGAKEAQMLGLAKATRLWWGCADHSITHSSVGIFSTVFKRQLLFHGFYPKM